MSANSRLFLVDGSSLAFRSFYALITSGMRNSDGIPTWAVYGFLSSLFDMIDKYKPHSVAIFFDRAEPTFRHEEFEDYKANRQEMPDDLSIQWPFIKRAVETFSIPVLDLAGYEADDLIGTATTRAVAAGVKVHILTGDQDSFQLLQDGVEVLMPTRDGLKTFGRPEVFEKLGVWPEQIVDYKGLCGDTSDNIPGVRGIGPKTAVQLLSQFGTIENIYEHLDEIKSNSVKTKLTEGRENAFNSKRLATIDLNVPMEFDADCCPLKNPDTDKVIDFLQELGLRNFLRRLPKILANFNDGVEPKIDSSRLSSGSKKQTPAAAAAVGETGAPPAYGGRPMQLSLLERPAAETPTIPAVTTKIISNESQFVELLNTLERSGAFAMDMRFTGLHADPNIIGMGFAWGAPLTLLDDNRLLVGSQAADITTAYLPFGRKGEVAIPTEAILARMKSLLENPKVAKMGTDIKQLLKAFALADIDPKGVAFDPGLASYINNPSESHKLSAQTERMLGLALPEISDLVGTGKKALPLDMLPSSVLGPAAADSARMVLELASRYIGKFDEDQRELLWAMDLPMAAVLARIELNGVGIDTSYFKGLNTTLSAEMARLEKEIFTLAGHDFNVNSPLQLQKVLFDEMKLPAKVRTKSGFSTDAAVLEELAEDHEVVRKILEYRQVTKLVSTYVESLPKQLSSRDARLHTEFNQASTATGRLSSSNPNLQNIPIRSELGQKIRRGFVASGDNVLVSADYSQIELRFLAHMSGDENLIEAFKSGEDIHKRTAMLIFDIPEGGEVTSAQRGVGKTLNFALIYQQGAFATGKKLGITTREAQAFTEKYFKSFPRVRSFMSRVIEEARDNTYVQTLWGRRRYFTHLSDRNDGIRRADERAAFNAPLQGSAADLMKLAMIRLDSELRSRKLKSKLILQVHDELVLEVPPDELEEAKQLVSDSMGMGQPLSVPLQVDVGVGKNWMDAK